MWREPISNGLRFSKRARSAEGGLGTLKRARFLLGSRLERGRQARLRPRLPVTDKREILKRLQEHVSADLATMHAAQRSVVEGATHEENKPENDKDTRALEQSYLARGQALRVVELQGELNQLKAMELRSFSADTAIALGALVVVDDG